MTLHPTDQIIADLCAASFQLTANLVQYQIDTDCPSDIRAYCQIATAVLLDMIRNGSPQGQGKMPAWKGKLSEQEMQDVVAYIKSLWSDPVYRLWWKMEQQSLEP